jgi:hypothetical protein
MNMIYCAQASHETHVVKIICTSDINMTSYGYATCSVAMNFLTHASIPLLKKAAAVVEYSIVSCRSLNFTFVIAYLGYTVPVSSNMRRGRSRQVLEGKAKLQLPSE